MPNTEANLLISRDRSKAATVPVFAAIVLIILKSAATLITGSLSILASLIDSVLDLSASSINRWALRHAEEPPDREHRFGHGKAESLSAILQSALILGSAAALLWQAFIRFMDPKELQGISIGIGAMIISFIVSVLLSIYLFRMAKQLNSLALKADAHHYFSDIISNGAILIALILIYLFQWNWIDSVVCLIAAAILIQTAYSIAQEAIQQLMDQELPEPERLQIKDIAMQVSPKIFGLHELRTRRSGQTIIVQMHLEIDSSLSFIEAHDISAKVQEAIENTLGDCIATIHADPYDAKDKNRKDLCHHGTIGLEEKNFPDGNLK